MVVDGLFSLLCIFLGGWVCVDGLVELAAAPSLIPLPSSPLSPHAACPPTHPLTGVADPLVEVLAAVVADADVHVAGAAPTYMHVFVVV